jgi:flagellar protein FlaJ
MVTLITKASETTGNIKETLKVAANDAALAEKIKRQKFATLFSYLVVVYISFAVFLMVLYVFTTMFLPHIPDNASLGYSRLSLGINKEEYVRLFMHGSIIQGFFSGIIIGQMIGGNVYDGLNHSILMITIAYVFFTVFI